MGVFSSAVIVLTLSIVISQLPTWLQTPLPKKGEGFAAPGWRKVADVFRHQLDTGQERGASFSVYYNGQLVVEFVGGYADAEAEVPWKKDTMSWFCSATKVTMAVTMAMLVDRHLLDYSHPVKEYWPEFGQNGKEDITVEQLLSHQTGLVAVEEEYSAYDILNDPDTVGQILARLKPAWKPGTAHGYQGITVALYADQLVRRVDPLHRSLSQFFEEEVAKPFGIDFYIGLPKEENYRFARIHPMPMLSPETWLATGYWAPMYDFFFNPDSLLRKSLRVPVEYNQDNLVNNPSYREIPTASSHGFGTGSGMARLMGILASGGEHEGRTLLSPRALAALNEPLAAGKDLIFLRNVTWGRGTYLRDVQRGGFMLGHPGMGGQMAYADLAHGLGWAYVTNYHSVYSLGDNPRYLALERAIYESLWEVQKKS